MTLQTRLSLTDPADAVKHCEQSANTHKQLANSYKRDPKRRGRQSGGQVTNCLRTDANRLQTRCKQHADKLPTHSDSSANLN